MIFEIKAKDIHEAGLVPQGPLGAEAPHKQLASKLLKSFCRCYVQIIFILLPTIMWYQNNNKVTQQAATVLITYVERRSETER